MSGARPVGHPERWLPARPCVGMVETASIAAGIEAVDRMLKEAPVAVVFAGPVSTGRWLSLVTGEVEEVRSALRSGVAAAADTLIDQVLIPQAAPDLVPALRGEVRPRHLDALGVLETAASTAAVLAADRAAKRAAVQLLELHLAPGIGGKGWFAITGEVSDVEAALREAAAEARARDLLVREVLIPKPDPGTWPLVLVGR
ncbi:MAG: BMC domain-containing protein [Planctomycetes bacterium]|nr:BMC domain-containing protein [Planctomycetota bacterium]